MPIINKEKWDNFVDVNKDPYSRACVNVARKVMELIDERPEEPLSSEYKEKMSVHALICEADFLIKAGGITGYMAGCVASMVSECHSRGKEFRNAWNKMHGISEEIEGTVNPAVITLSLNRKE